MRTRERVGKLMVEVTGKRFCTSCQSWRKADAFVHYRHRRWLCADCARAYAARKGQA